MIQLHVEEAPTVLACIGSVGTHRGRNRDESPGFWFEWMELPLAEMGKPGWSQLRAKSHKFSIGQIMLEKPFKYPW